MTITLSAYAVRVIFNLWGEMFGYLENKATFAVYYFTNTPNITNRHSKV